MTWTPSFENGGHECLVAAAYGTAFGEGLPPTLDANPADRDTNQGYLSIAQHNLGVLSLGSIREQGHGHPLSLPGLQRLRRGARVRRQGAAGAPLGDRPFSAGRARRPDRAGRAGDVERLGLVASAKPDAKELETAPAVLPRVRIAPRSCRQFTLGGSLERGNALINVTQSHGERVVGGLSVSVMAEAK